MSLSVHYLFYKKPLQCQLFMRILHLLFISPVAQTPGIICSVSIHKSSHKVCAFWQIHLTCSCHMLSQLAILDSFSGKLNVFSNGTVIHGHPTHRDVTSLLVSPQRRKNSHFLSPKDSSFNVKLTHDVLFLDSPMNLHVHMDAQLHLHILGLLIITDYTFGDHNYSLEGTH